MPYIDLKTTKTCNNDQCETLKAAFGKAIESFPGKTEAWLMVNIEDAQKLWFKGNSSADSAMVDVALFGKANSSAYDKMTKALTVILSGELGIPTDRIYIKYSEVEHWGWNGNNF